MVPETIPDDLRRFIHTSVISVPYLEAMLLLRDAPDDTWNAARLAKRLYMDENRADELLTLLRQAGILRLAVQQPSAYCYEPVSDELRQMIDLLADWYRTHLVEVTNLIHSTTHRQAQRFADAFRLRKET